MWKRIRGRVPVPNRPRVPCTTPGCTGTAPGGRCDRCLTRQARGSSAARGYGRTWRARRIPYLVAHPWCVLCGRPATVPDHHPASRRQLEARGVAIAGPRRMARLAARPGSLGAAEIVALAVEIARRFPPA